MKEIDPIENWLNTVAFNHSNSLQTRTIYKAYFRKFLDHAQTTAESILQDYNASTSEKEFKQKYTPIIMSLIGEMSKQNLSQSTKQCVMATIKSFFKYNSLPLGYIPTGKQLIEFHNRDIEKEEIEKIIEEAQPREKAYYALMVQSGLRPQTISELAIGDLEGLLDENTPIPCLIKVPQDKTKGQYSEYFTFTSKESIVYIKEYLKRERNQPLTLEDYLFTMKHGKSPVRPDVINHTFKRTVEKLKTQNILNFKTIKKDMPNEKRKSVSRNELRLYNLRKYFRNNAHVGWDYVNFWMGHIAKLGSDKHYFSQTNIEQHRQRYKEKAMPHLSIETTTPDEIAPIITDLQNRLTQRDNENKELKERLTKIENIVARTIDLERYECDLPPEAIEQNEKLIKEEENNIKTRAKWRKEHPEEFRQQKEQQEKRDKEFDKYLEEHPEITEQMEKQTQQLYIEALEAVNKDFSEFKEKLQKIIKQTARTEKQT